MKSGNSLTKTLLLTCVAGFLSMMGTAGQASADNIDYEGPFVRLHGGLNFALDTDYDGNRSDAFPSGEAKLGTGAMVGMSGGYRFNRNFSADLEYSYRSNDIDEVTKGGARIADGGDLASVAIMANGNYYFDFSDSWSPYVGLGVGFLQEIDSDVELVGVADQKDLEDQVFAWQATIGAEVPVDNNWRFYGEGRFLSAPGVDLSNSNGSYSVDYNNLSLLIGIGYQF